MIKNPINLISIQSLLKSGEFYRSKEQLYADLKVMITNCKTYNKMIDSEYYQCADAMEMYIAELFYSENGSTVQGGANISGGGRNI